LSLILDALRRADSERERERGAVPGLHAQQVPAFTPEARQPAGARPWRWFVIVAGTGLLAALVAWFIASRETPRQIAAAAAARQPAAAAPAAPSAPSTTVAAAPPPATATSPRTSAAEPQPVAEPAPWPSQDSTRKAPTVEVASAPAARAPEIKAVPPAGAAPVESPITPREQLPENIRAQLPPLAVGGSIYSANAPDRSVIIDGRILRENDRLTADLTLEQIRPKSAVLRIKGHRFEIGF
jgi:general secretion pathway protein B